MSDDPPGTFYGPLRRDVVGHQVCTCGHLTAEHRQDQTRRACSICPGCTSLVPHTVVYVERRTVWVPLEPAG